MSDFFQDILTGLTANPKYLLSKYFYDETGDALFREIMACPEYYLTRCEMEIFTTRQDEIANVLVSHLRDFDVVELGAGDATKSVHLLEALMKQQADFTYYPIDVSANIISLLEQDMPARLPGLRVNGLNGEYFEMLSRLKQLSARNKVVLFLGSNIGNILLENAVNFFKELRSYLSPGDLVLTGFDLVKAPALILAAYNDAGGITRRFNLNLLTRINRTLHADFDISQFEHRPVYDEQTGACRSYLESKRQQQVRIGSSNVIDFAAGEQIFMEIAQKYTPQQTDAIGDAAGFVPVRHFYDSRQWFLDALWQCR